MDDKIKFGESYKSIADNIKPYLDVPIIPISISNNKAKISKYPPWWETTITLYNSYTDTITSLVTWYRHIISNCYFKNIYESLELNNIVMNNNHTLIRIPESTQYLPYEEWVKIPNIDISKYFTLHQGDIIIKGSVSDVIDETKKGMFSNDIIEKYKALGICTVIQATQSNTGTQVGTPHYRVMGD